MADTYIRSLNLPIMDVAEGYQNGQWQGTPEARTTFRFCLNLSWREATRAANWMVTRLAAHEPTRVAGQEQPAKYEGTREVGNLLYAEGRNLFPDLDSQILGLLRNNIIAHYMAHRWNVFGYGSESLQTFRYPLPLPLPAESFPVLLDADGVACLRLRLAGSRFTVRLATGKDFAWHQEILAGIAAGTVKRGAAKLWLGKKKKDLMVGIPAHLTREAIVKPISNALLVKTDPKALFTVEIEGKRRKYPLICNEDWLKGQIIRHALFRQRFSEDMRHEVRRNRQFKRNHYRALDSRCESHNRRVDDRLHKVTRSVVDFAVRNRVGMVIYDDTDRSWVKPFPWYRVRLLLKEKLEERDQSIEFIGRPEANDEDEQP